jgi:hypothetical protein
VVGKNSVGRRVRKTLEYNLHLERLPPYDEAEAEELSQLEAKPPSSGEQRDICISFSTVTPAAFSPQHAAAVSALKTKPAESTNTNTKSIISVNLSGSITLSPRMANTLQATVSASIEVSTSSSNQIAHAPSEEVGAVILHFFLALVGRLHSMFARYDEVDEATLQHFETVVVPTAPPPKSHEASLISRSLLYNSEDFRRIPGTVNETVEYYQRKVDGDSGWGKGVAIVDTPAARVFAWLFCVETNERVINHGDDEGPSAFRSSVISPESHHSMLYSATLALGFGLDDRIISAWFTWERDESGGFLLAFAPMKECYEKESVAAMEKLIKKDARALKAKEAGMKGFWKIEVLAASVCRVTLVTQGKLGGIIPIVIMNTQIKRSLGLVKKIQSKFERRGEDVDAELRAAFDSIPAIQNLSADQGALIARCEAMTTAGGFDWRPIKSPQVFVDMWMVIIPQQPSEPTKVLAKAKCLIDAPARIALAWMYTYCSRERMRISKEKGDIPRIVESMNSDYDCTLASLKRSPFPLTNREYFSREICTVEDENTDALVLVSEPMDSSAKVDYGATFKTVRAATRVHSRFVPLNATQCQVTFHLHFDFGGRIPQWAATAQVPKTLSTVGDLRNIFQRDDEVDAAERYKLVQGMKHERQDYSEEEERQIKNVQENIGRVSEDMFEQLDSPDTLVKMGVHFKKGESIGVLRATATVDATIEEIAAWEFLSDSRKNSKQDAASGMKVLAKSAYAENDHSSLFHMVIDFSIPGFSPREWLVRLIWKWGDNMNSLIIAVKSVDHHSFPEDPRYVRAINNVIWKYNKLLPVNGTAQTQLTTIQHMDLGGAIPKFALNGQAVDHLMRMSVLRNMFDRTADIDGASRASIVDMIERHAAPYTEQENAIIDSGLAHFDRFQVEGNVEEVKTISPLSQNELAQVKGDRLAWGRSRITERTTPEDALAYQWDFMARHLAKADTIEKEVLEEANEHNKIVHMVKVIPKPFRDRELVMRFVWKKLDDDTFVFVIEPTSHEKYPEGAIRRGSLSGLTADKGERARARFPTVVKFTRAGTGLTKVDYLLQLDIGGNDLGNFSSLMRIYLVQQLKRTFELNCYFQALRGSEEYDAVDGEAVGEVMMVRTKTEELRRRGETKSSARMREMFKRYRGLREINAKHKFFKVMMARVVQNKLRSAGDVKTKLCNVSLKEGGSIGAGLAMSLASSLTSEAAVDEWISKYPALIELDREEVWFRPMMNAVALRLLGEVSWGLKMRVYMGAGLGVLDMVSDINVILLYTDDPETVGYGMALLTMLAANVGISCLIIFFQCRTRPWKMLREMLFAFTGLKPGYVRFLLAVGSASH